MTIASDSTRNLDRSIRRLQLFGIAMTLALVGGVGMWASTAQISGAIISSGQLVVDTDTKKVQHTTGGKVGEILARNGDRVEKGAILFRLDATVTRANLAIVTKRLDEMEARKARLAAERDGLAAIAFPHQLTSRSSDPDVRAVISGEQRLFDLRLQTREGQKEQLVLRVKQIEGAIEGIQIQSDAKRDEIKFITRELKGARTLSERGLMPITKLTQLEREATRTTGEYGSLKTSVSRAEAQVSETKLQLLQIDRELASEVASELRDVEAQIGEFVERRITADSELSQIDIRAPQSGIVFESTVDTVGGVISAGQVVMQIVPMIDELKVEAQIAPADIDQLREQQTAILRLTAFSASQTPEFTGRVSRISPNVTIDRRTGASYYLVRLDLDQTEIAKSLPIGQLKAGMPVESYFKTADRSVMSYLMKPLIDQFNRTFRDG